MEESNWVNAYSLIFLFLSPLQLPLTYKSNIMISSFSLCERKW